MQNKNKIGLAPRLAALNAILKFKEGKGFVLENLQTTCEELPENDRALAYEIALGTTRTTIDINSKLKKFVKKTPQEPVRSILEISLYQLFYTRIPPYAAINSAVELAREFGIGGYGAKFVNAVLRNAQRGEIARGETKAPLQWIRINPQKTTIENVIAELKLNAPKILFDRFVNVPNAGEALKNPLFAKGFYSFQDPASFYVKKLCGEISGAVWDACAAPGGKSAMLAEDFPYVFFVASDVNKKRAEKLLDLQNRLGLKNVYVCVADAENPPFAVDFDCILLDVPCSNLGVINRRPEAAIEKRGELAERQFQILTSASKKLKVGGILIYSTCTQEKTETSEVIEKFLSADENFIQEEFVFTNDADVDKFFVARLRRVK